MPNIAHVVVLMLENRSFDCMLGRLYPGDPTFKGLTLNESNNYGMTYSVWQNTGMDPATACIPDPDPGESFDDMNMQLFGNTPRSAAAPTMCGFAQNYGTQAASSGWCDPGAVMHYFTPDQAPNISALAKAFGVCDEWYASAPCQTWPNRFFTHTGTALGYVDNHDFPIPFSAPSIFQRLESQNQSWRVYFHDMPQSLLLGDVWSCAALRYRAFSQFIADAAAGSLPSYSFIEPRYFTDLFKNSLPNDEHPPHNVLYGEALIASVYNALRSSPCWKQTLFIITYDEHGGCYDHVPPPTAVPPDGVVANAQGFSFDAYGVRVPSVIISPYIAPGTRIKAPVNADGNTYPFDHTSIIATVRGLFIPADPPLTARDAHAPSLMSALNLAVPANDGPDHLDETAPAPTVDLLSVRSNAAPNSMQAALASAAALLPVTPLQLNAVPAPPTVPTAQAFGTVAVAQLSATARTNSFLAQTSQ
jgi:phospholipase C